MNCSLINFMNYLTVKYVGHVIPVRELLIRIKENGGIDTEDLDIDFLESFISGNNSPQDLRNIHWELNESIVYYDKDCSGDILCCKILQTILLMNISILTDHLSTSSDFIKDALWDICNSIDESDEFFEILYWGFHYSFDEYAKISSYMSSSFCWLRLMNMT